MGACAIGKQNEKVSNYLSQFPDDIEQYDPEDMNFFDFQGSLCNVKIENSAADKYKKFGLCFQIPEIVNILCPSIECQKQKAKWQINTNFQFKCNDYQMRSKFLQVSIIEGKDKVLASFKINLYRIMTGPYHLDFKISKGKKQYGRLIFDMKINQIVQMTIDSLKTSVVFKKEYPGQRFNYKIETHNIHLDKDEKAYKTNKTIPSYIQQVPLNKEDIFRPITLKDQAPSPTIRIKRKGSNIIRAEEASQVVWDNQENKKLPSVILRVKANSLFLTSLIIKICRFSNHQKKLFFGKCNLTVSQLFKEADYSSNKTGLNNKAVKITKNLYYNGKIIGNCNLVFSIKCHRFIKQTNNNSLTQDGIVNMHHFETYKCLNSPKNDEINDKNEMLSLYKQIVSLIEKNNSNSSPKLRVNQTIFKSIEELEYVVSKTLKASMIYYPQEKLAEVQEKQILNINILKLMANILEDSEGDLDLREICWKIVININKRGEMMLRNWGFYDWEKSSCKNYEQKAKVAEQYCEETYHLLRLALDTNFPANGEKQSSEFFKAICYFRVPIFRGYILEFLHEDNSNLPQIVEAIDTDYNDEFSDINWEKLFYQPLKNSKKVQELQASMDKFLQDSLWLQKISEKDDIFFVFVRYLMAKIVTIREHHKIDSWGGLPGYETIISAALSSLKKENLIQWSYQLILMSISIIENQQFFPFVLQVIYRKTNLYNELEVRKMLSILSQFLHQQTSNRDQNKYCLPAANFPYKYFISGLKLILENSGHHLSIRLALIFIFKFYSDFDTPFRLEFSKYILGGMFYKLFYHWSYDVRDVFYHIIILKIVQDKQLLRFGEISQRLNICIRIIENSNYLSEKQTSLNSINEKKSIHERMRNKQRLRQKNKSKKNGLRTTAFMDQDISLAKKSIKFSDLMKNDHLKKQQFSLRQYRNIKLSSPKKKTVSPVQIETKSKDKNVQKREILELQSIESTQKSETSTFHDGYINIADHIVKRKPSISSRLPKMKKQISSTSSIHDNTIMEYGFAEHQLQLAELSDQQVLNYSCYFQVATSRFKEVLGLVHSYYEEHCQLPCMQDKLDVLGVKLDRKDIMPEQLHFQIFD